MNNNKIYYGEALEKLQMNMVRGLSSDLRAHGCVFTRDESSWSFFDDERVAVATYNELPQVGLAISKLIEMGKIPVIVVFDNVPDNLSESDNAIIESVFVKGNQVFASFDKSNEWHAKLVSLTEDNE